ncbi:unnamed protein product, partial [Rotaria socialis]
VSNRLARTLEDLADFDFTVRWIPGNTNVIADALSRVNDSDIISEENVRSDMQVDPIGSQLTLNRANLIVWLKKQFEGLI